MAETFLCPTPGCEAKIPADAGRLAGPTGWTGPGEAPERTQRAYTCPDCNTPLVRAADQPDSAWDFQRPRQEWLDQNK
jgi:hypothetical protein